MFYFLNKNTIFYGVMYALISLLLGSSFVSALTLGCLVCYHVEIGTQVLKAIRKPITTVNFLIIVWCPWFASTILIALLTQLPVVSIITDYITTQVWPNHILYSILK